ncbi:MAG TPA: hypothetical protein PKM70_07145, partial [Clostridia bacterium]|nr:hypothetical protein [Clostridia bacterium]
MLTLLPPCVQLNIINYMILTFIKGKIVPTGNMRQLTLKNMCEQILPDQLNISKFFGVSKDCQENHVRDKKTY